MLKKVLTSNAIIYLPDWILQLNHLQSLGRSFKEKMAEGAVLISTMIIPPLEWMLLLNRLQPPVKTYEKATMERAMLDDIDHIKLSDGQES